MEDNNKFPDRLRELRGIFNITQKDMAERLDLTASMLSAYETGVRNPSIEILLKIAKIYNISLDWLLGLNNENMTRNNDINNYADIFNFFLNLEQKNFCITNFSIEEDILGFSDGDIYLSLDIYSSFLAGTVEEWRKMLDLKNNGTITEELFTLWLNNKMRKLNDTVID